MDDLTVNSGGVMGTGGLSIATFNLYAADTLHVTGGLTIQKIEIVDTGITLENSNLVVDGSGEGYTCIHTYICSSETMINNINFVYVYM